MGKKPKKKNKNMKAGTDPLAHMKQQTPQKPNSIPSRQSVAQARSIPTQSLAQKRAKDALDKIIDIGEDYGNYLAFVKALPATIIMTGLGQALAMVKAGSSKDGDVGKGNSKLYEHLDTWLRSKWRQENGQQVPTDILQAIIKGNEPQYIHAQSEAMEYLEWLKKFAVAYLVDKDETGSEHKAGEAPNLSEGGE